MGMARCPGAAGKGMASAFLVTGSAVAAMPSAESYTKVRRFTGGSLRLTVVQRIFSHVRAWICRMVNATILRGSTRASPCSHGAAD